MFIAAARLKPGGLFHVCCKLPRSIWLLLLVKLSYFLIYYNYWGNLNILMKVSVWFYFLVFEQ